MSISEDLESISPWMAEAPDPAPTLHGEHEADATIVGAGMTGLSSALSLRREGLQVVVLEAQRAGFGASGRNAGQLTPTIGKDLFTLTRIYGRERVGGLVHLMETAISHVESLIQKHGIECDYEPVGNVIAAVHPRQHRNLDRAAEAAALHGVPGEVLEPDEMERRALPRAFTRGYFEPHGGVLNPGRYVAGLRRAALAAGAVLYERSPVVTIEASERPVVRTPRGSVRSRCVVIATNAYTSSLGRLRWAGLPLRVQLFQTEPLTRQQRDAVGWSGRQGVYTAHEILENYRRTADHRILGGTKAIRYRFGGRELPDVEASVSARLEETFRARFPELADVRIARHWGGPIHVGLDFLPLVRRLGRHRNLFCSIAYAGHGIPLASYAGEMLADLFLERDGPGRALWSRRALPTPPEPLRWLTFRALNGILSRIDERSDRTAPGRGHPAG
jgi:glycine/D-amino acid oxidase-like deaminating enzyme